MGVSIEAAPRTPRVIAAGISNDLAHWLCTELDDIPIVTTSDGEDALRELEPDSPAVLLIDHSQAGGLAVDITRRLHASGGAGQHVRVIYLLERDQGAPPAGAGISGLQVDRVVFHPIDRSELARHIRALLHNRGAPTVAGESKPEPLAAVAALWERFRDPILDRVRVLERAVVALEQGPLHSELRAAAISEAHKLAGSAGTFGFPEGSRLARLMEAAFQADPPPGSADAPRLAEWVSSLRSELEESPATPSAPTSAVIKQPQLLVVGAEPGLGARLCTEAAERGIKGLIVEGVPEARRVVADDPPDVAVLDLSVSERMPEGLEFLKELTSREAPIPALVLTARDTLADRVEVARLGGRGFLEKPFLPTEILDAAARLLQSTRAVHARVLAVDDDPVVLAALESLLVSQGLEVIVLDEPLRFWDVLQETSPDLLIVDVDMPHLNGIELCRVVRNDPRWGGLPILFLTAHSDSETLHRVFAAGADDFVTKPFVGPEVVTRIMSRLEKAQLQKSFAETDVLTGVANRRKAVQVIQYLLRLAMRQGKPVSIAVIDLDHFKQVNDRYGHAAGDEVLRRVGATLLGSFRGEDMVARWGGEEFVLGLFGMGESDGIRRLRDLLQTVREHEFTASDGTPFGVSFSCGLAQFPEDGTDLETLYRVADGALYRAKVAGRSRVIHARADAGEPGGAS